MAYTTPLQKKSYSGGTTAVIAQGPDYSKPLRAATVAAQAPPLLFSPHGLNSWLRSKYKTGMDPQAS